MKSDSVYEIERQRRMLGEDYSLDIYDSCLVGNGIVLLTEEEQQAYIATSDVHNLSMFIPASGSGSRMFQFLNEFISSGVVTQEVERFFNHLIELPFAIEGGEKLSQDNWLPIAKFLMAEEGANFGKIPKGLVPFHKYDEKVLNAFQDHATQLQDSSLSVNELHFTVDESFIEQIGSSIRGEVSSSQSELTFSIQDPETHAFCFDNGGELVYNGSKPLRRPSGHGALINNLNEMGNSIVLVKNIDNIQHQSKNSETELSWRLMVGVLVEFNEDLKNLSSNFDMNALTLFNNKYQIFHKEHIEKISQKHIELMMGRPSRICGMVKNEGEPGGGPFWIADGESISKQIVEKGQVRNSQVNSERLKSSTHFNPVFMALSLDNAKGVRCDLSDYINANLPIPVVKDQNGEKVKYHEQPGLWNGAMHNWNTIFIELSTSIFTPVKSALDLLRSPHRP